jgi:Ca2+-binding EF-hand superfamily protein
MAHDAQRRELIDKVSALFAERFGCDFRKAFEHYDRDKQDGGINRADLMELLADAGIGSWLTRSWWAVGVLDALDNDKDGVISQAELDAVLEAEG